MTESEENRPIPRLPGNRFLHENWWAAGPTNFTWTDAKDVKYRLIGWCPASKVFFRPGEDENCLAVMFTNNRWCHMSYEMIIDYCADLYDWFDMFNFEGLDRKIIDDWVESKRRDWRG